jgi:hypothetical protein
MAFQCFDDPAAILEKAFCVTQTSKDLKGELQLSGSKGQKCKELNADSENETRAESDRRADDL